MKRTIPSLSVITVALCASVLSGLSGQGLAELAGTWVAVVEQEAPSLEFRSRVDLFCGPRCTIAVESTRLVVTRADAVPPTVVFWLDERVSRNEFKVAGVPVRLESTAKISPGAVVLSGRADRGGLQSVSTLTVKVEGSQLVVERLGQGRASRNPVRILYRRSGGGLPR